MTATTATEQSTRPASGLALPAAAALVIALAFNAWGVFADGSAGAEPSLREFLIIGGVSALAVALVFGVVAPQVMGGSRAAGVGLGLAIAGLVLVVVFWSGLTPPLAIGGIVLGAHARRVGRKPGTGGAAIAIGTLALLGYAASYVTDWMATNNIAGM